MAATEGVNDLGQQQEAEAGDKDHMIFIQAWVSLFFHFIRMYEYYGSHIWTQINKY